MRTLVIIVLIFGISFSTLLTDYALQEKNIAGDKDVHENIRNFVESKQLLDVGMTEDEKDHLDDVRILFHLAGWIFFVVGLIFLTSLGTFQAANFRNAGIIILIFLVLIYFVPFEIFFTFLHKLFFRAGTWTFSSDSVLISTYPLIFWQKIGISLGLRMIFWSILSIGITEWCRHKKS